MKLIATYTPHLDIDYIEPYVFRGNIQAAIKSCQQFRFDGLELALSGAHDINLSSINANLQNSNIEIMSISSNPIYELKDLSLASENFFISNKATALIFELIDFAQAYGAPVIIDKILGSQVRGECITDEAVFSRIHSCLDVIVDYACKKGVTILLAANNNIGMSVKDSARLVRKINSPRLRLAVNTWRIVKFKESLYSAVIENSDIIEYIQISDTDYIAAGLGRIGFKPFFKALDVINYDGCICAAAIPKSSPDQVLNITLTMIVRGCVMLHCI